MIDVATRLLSAFCKDPTHGINEMAGSLPRANLSGPDDAAPPVVPIFNDVEDATVAHDLTAPVLPAVIIWGDSHAPITLRGYKMAKEVIICAAFLTDDTVDDLVMNRACGYILRGGLLTFSRFNNQEYSAGYRELNGIKIMELSRVTEQRISAAVGRQKMWGFLAVQAIVVETYS